VKTQNILAVFMLLYASAVLAQPDWKWGFGLNGLPAEPETYDSMIRPRSLTAGTNMDVLHW
jgi:hypothetical protein